MTTCRTCGTVIPPSARFCPGCAAAVDVAFSRSEVGQTRVARKTVTVLFSDLAGSTALGEQLDPEQLRALMSRYFGAMAEIIERHGGTVEKYIGDAIMAVFGIPEAHEDDALRAVRAAWEMRTALAALNAELEGQGVEIRTRTGINTGEVVTGDPASGGTLVTGDAVNTAARLEQAAGPGEVLLGDATRRLVRDHVVDEPVPPLELKGKARPVPAARIVSVAAQIGPVRRVGGPFVGRDPELNVLRAIWDRVVRERSPQLVTVVAPAGVGKSRLLAEFIGGLRSASVLRGRCLPYGEGITYWPLAEVLRSAAGVEEPDSRDIAMAKLQDLVRDAPGGERIAKLLGEAIGLSGDGAAQDELFWAARRALEHLARRQPALVVWDDLQWAQPTFLDLLELLVEWCRDVPMLFVAMARPELADVRPGWGAGPTNAIVVTLEPLGEHSSTELLAALPGGSALPDELRTRITETAEGNPLYLEEILKMLVDEGRLMQRDGHWMADADVASVPVPGSISALLAARLDRLGHGERQVAERAAVVGRTFERGAVVELSPPDQRPEVLSRLLALVRKEVVRPEPQPGLDGDDAYRFRHLLIRDTAYEAMPKTERASLHVAFAGWLERVAGDRIIEYEEVVAHHLDRAYRYQSELGMAGSTDIGQRAATWLTAAARRAQMRGDLPAAFALRQQTLDLPIPDDHRVDLLIQQARGHLDTGDADAARATLDAAEAAATGVDDEALRMRIAVGRGFVATTGVDEPNYQTIIADARRAAEVLEVAGDDVGVARAMELVAHGSFFAADYATARDAWREAAERAVRGGDRSEAARILPALPATATYGLSTATEAVAYCRELAERFPEPPMLQTRIYAVMAFQLAAMGDREAAREAMERSRAVLDDLGLPWLTGEIHVDYADVQAALGNHADAEREALLAWELTARARWPNAWISLLALMDALRKQDRMPEVRPWLALLEQSAAGSIASRAYVDAWRAIVDAWEGNASVARGRLVSTSVPGFDPGEDAGLMELRAEAWAPLGEVSAAIEALEAAATTYERKEWYGYLERVRERIRQLRAG